MTRVIAAVVFFALLCSATALVPQPTGRLINIGARKLHINCTGAGSPTVVVENGGAAFSFDWALVQSQVARFTRICTYDRAGYAWSDLAPEFDTFDQANHDLHLLLKMRGFAAPTCSSDTLLAGCWFGFTKPNIQKMWLDSYWWTVRMKTAGSTSG